MKKWRIDGSGNLREIEIDKETDKMIIYTEHGRTWREAKESDHAYWHDTKEGAKDWYISKRSSEIAKYWRWIESNEASIARVKEK